MKILFLSPTGAIGGAERVLLSALRAMQQSNRKYHCHLLAISDGPLLEQAAQLGVATSVLPAPAAFQSFGDSRFSWLKLLCKSIPLAWSTYRYIRQLRKVLRELQPDLIHSNGIKTHALLWLAGTGATPVLWHVHDFLSRRKLARRVLSRAVGQVAGAIAISEAVATDLRLLWPNLKVFTVANAIDTNFFCPGQTEGGLLDKLANLPSQDCLRVGLVATYAIWKGHDVFLRAAARVLQDGRIAAVRFYIIGGPIYATSGSQFQRAGLTALARRLQIDSAVGFIDFQADIRSTYRSLDIVVHASTAPEPFGLTIIEAMACGKPVIVSEAGGAAEIARSGKGTVGVPPGDEMSMANAIYKLLDSEHLRSTMGIDARQTVCDRFDQRRFEDELLEMINRFVRIPLAEPNMGCVKA